MFHVCPLCNGIISPEISCSDCFHSAIDSGKIVDYVGPYAPYQSDDSFPVEMVNIDGSVHGQCLHIIYCEHCHAINYANGMNWA